MKTLKESLLDDIETTMNNGVLAVAEDVVRDIIQKDYKLYKRYKSDITVVGKAKSGKILINGKGKIEFINKTAKSVVNDIFEWNEINGEFMCFKCNIESLEGFPRKVDASNILGKCAINVNQCRNLKTLKGAPDIIFGDFYCIECDSLTSLEGAPDKIYGDFDCSGCKSLKSLKGLPSSIEGSLYLPKIDSLFDEVGREIISKTHVKGDPCVVPIK